METPPPYPDCPLNVALEQVGDRCSMLILGTMILGGKRRCGEFLDAVDGIDTDILANHLRLLERHGLVATFADPDQRQDVVYLPTDKGLDLMPVLLELIRWGLKYEPGCRVSPEIDHSLRHGCHDLLVAARTAVMAERDRLIARAGPPGI